MSDTPEYIPLREALERTVGIDRDAVMSAALGSRVYDLVVTAPQKLEPRRKFLRVLFVLGLATFAFLGLLARHNAGLVPFGLGAALVLLLVAPFVASLAQRLEATDDVLLKQADRDKKDVVSALIRFRRDLGRGAILAFEKRAVDGPGGVWRPLAPDLFAADQGWVLIVGKPTDWSLVRTWRPQPKGEIWIDANTLSASSTRSSRTLIESSDDAWVDRVMEATLAGRISNARQRLDNYLAVVAAFRKAEIRGLGSVEKQIEAVSRRPEIAISDSTVRQIRYGLYRPLENKLIWAD